MNIAPDEAIVLLKYETSRSRFIWHKNKKTVNEGGEVIEITDTYQVAHAEAGTSIWFKGALVGLRGPEKMPCFVIVDLCDNWHYYDAIGENEKMIRNFINFVKEWVIQARTCERCRLDPDNCVPRWL